LRAWVGESKTAGHDDDNGIILVPKYVVQRITKKIGRLQITYCGLMGGSESIKMILTKDIASKVLQKNLSELILLANQSIRSDATNQFRTSICSIKIVETIEVIEAVSEYVSSYRKSGKLIVTDGRNLTYFPTNEGHHFTDFNTRQLRATEDEDMKIIRRLMEKALELSIKKVTAQRKMHGSSFERQWLSSIQHSGVPAGQLHGAEAVLGEMVTVSAVWMALPAV
jgi:hypothetical protein